MSRDFQPGDIVTQKSGGPPMTVCGVEDEKVICVRIENGKNAERRFEPAELVLEEDAIPPARADE
jgi:uncharacterized protein YodC (DUF2158 family)